MNQAEIRCYTGDHSFLTHILEQGSYGAPPNYVLEACTEKSQEIEENPDIFMRFTYPIQLRKARERVAELIKADVDDCVLVTNATLGVNTVLRNLEWSKEDVIVYSEKLPLPCRKLVDVVTSFGNVRRD